MGQYYYAVTKWLASSQGFLNTKWLAASYSHLLVFRKPWLDAGHLVTA